MSLTENDDHEEAPNLHCPYMNLSSETCILLSKSVSFEGGDDLDLNRIYYDFFKS